MPTALSANNFRLANIALPEIFVENHLVTIAIPTYNRADFYLRQALTCALNQTYSNIEIIVADNCSTDDTRTLVADIADSRLRYFRHEVNIGGNNNFNFCVGQAKGKYLLLLHDDDLVDEDFVETCVQAAADTPDVGMIRTGMRRIDMHGNVVGEVLNLAGGMPVEEFFLAWFAGKTSMHICSTLYNTRRLKEIGGFRSKHNRFDDAMAAVQLAAKYKRVDIPDAKASFRRHADQRMEKGQISTWCEDSLILLDLMCNLVPASKAALVRHEGMKCFIRHNYSITSRVKSPFRRLGAYGTVLKQFNYPFSLFIYLAVSRNLGFVKMRIKKTLKRWPSLKLKIDSFRPWRSQG